MSKILLLLIFCGGIFAPFPARSQFVPTPGPGRSTSPVDRPSVMSSIEQQTKFLLFNITVQGSTPVTNNRPSTAVQPSATSAPELFSPRTIEKGELKLVASRDWTSGFFPGELWLLYSYTGKDEWRQLAETFTEFMEKEKTNATTHDMGFKIECSFGNGYALTKNKAYREVIIQSARTLSTRFNPRIGCIRSWDHHRENWAYPVIIDNMMNLELLFNATRLTGDSSFYKIAVSHANTTMKNHFRANYSSFHVVDYDTLTGKVIKKTTWQGFSDSSAWARGQAWGLYAYTMCYRYTKDPAYLRQAEHIAAFILGHPRLPADKIPYWDFDAPGIPRIAGANPSTDEPRDASAAAIIASGLYELSFYSDKADFYRATADTILGNLTDHYRARPGNNKGFILLHSTGSKPSNSEVDVPLNYADYYYLEALLRSSMQPHTRITSGTTSFRSISVVTPPPPSSARPAPDTLSRDERMAWWREARFGMFIHWGVYAVLAGDYDGHPIGKAAEWIMNRGKIPVAEYQKVARQFNPVKYDPEAWVRMARDAGMKYIVITAKHHDGFALFGSKASKWNVVDATPYGKDLLRPLAAACRKYGIKLGFYYSQAQDWTNPGGTVIRKVTSEGWPNPDSTRIDAYTLAHAGHWDPAQTTDSMSDYIDKVAVPQVKELLTNYGEVAVLWWDTPNGMKDEYAEQLNASLSLQPKIITNDRLKRPNFPGDYNTPEQKIPKLSDLDGKDWETCMTMNGTWGYKASDHNWKTPTTLIHNLVDIASKGGNYLLNVGPTPEGEFPQGSIDALAAIGAWMKVNGEAIYDTKASPLAPLLWGRCTQKRTGNGNTILYLSVFDWPANGQLLVPGFNSEQNGEVVSATLLTGTTKLKTSAGTDGLLISVPGKASDPIATVIKLEIKKRTDQ